MTVADNTSRNQYTATSGQALFAYTFEIVDKDDIVVLINGTPLSEGTDYTVTGVGSDTGGNIVLTSGTTGGNIVTIYRDMAYERTQNYTNSGDFLASEVNSDFDRLWLAGEQTDRAFSQSIRKPITDSDSISMELPEAASRASKFLKFDANGAVDLAAGVTTDVDADDVSIADAGGYYTSDNVEGALQEIGAQPPGFDPNTDSFNIGSDAVSSGTDSIALGHDASATAARDIALGFDAVASGGGSIAIGQETDSTGVRSIAIGKGAQSTFSTSIALGEDASTLGGAGGSPVAIGYNASSTGTSGISLGPNTTASGSQSVSIGDSVSATGSGSTAIGQNASVTGSYSTALGFGATVTASTAAIAINDATASGVGSMAIHDNALSSGSYSMAIGYQSQATVGSAMAVGYSSQATAESSTALGHDASATGDKSIAIGFESYASFVDSIAIGNDTRSDALGSIAIGTGSDASQLGSVALGKGAQATGAGSTIAIGEAATTSGGLASPIAIGYQANTTGAYGVGLGYQTVTSGAQSIAIGYIASATNDNGIAIGRQLTVAGQKAVGIGWGVVAGDNDSIGIGTSANALTIDCISIGAGSESTSTGGVAIGGDASVTGNLYGVAVGYNATASEIGGVAIGHNALCESQFGMALGRDSSANAGGGYAVALGYGANANSNGTAINNADATGQRSIAISYNALASGDDSIAIGYNADALFDDAIAIGNVAGADAANTIHINASGVDTNQPQTAGYIVIETDDASLKYDGSWSLTGGPLNLSGGIDVTGSISADGLTVDGEGRIEETGAAARFIVSRTDALNVAETASIDLLEGSAGGSFGSANNYGFSIDLDGSNNTLNVLSGNQTAVTKRLSVARDTGDISFFEDTGTTAKFQWSASDESLSLDKTASGVTKALKLYNNTAGANNRVGIDFHTASTLYGTIEAGYGATSPEMNFKVGGVTPSQILKLTSTGIDVTGTVTADGLTVQSTSASATVASFKGSTGFGLEISASDVAPYVQNIGTSAGEEISLSPGGVRTALFQDGGDISFYDSSGTSQSLFWDASAERLGLGLTNPSQLLHLKSSGPDTYIQLGNNTVNAGYIGYNSAGDLNFWTNASTRAMTIDSSSNVGIGTSSISTSKLHVQGTTGTASAVRVESTAADSDAYYIADNDASVWTWGIDGGNSDAWTLSNAFGLGTPKLTVKTGGNVGIGTSLPSLPLSVARTSATAYATSKSFNVGGAVQVVNESNTAGTFASLELNAGTAFSSTASISVINENGSSNSASSLTFATRQSGTNNIVEAMRIDSSQNLLVGATEYPDDTINNTTGFGVASTGETIAAVNNGRAAVFKRMTSDGSIVEFYKDTATVGSIGTKNGIQYIAGATKGLRFDSTQLIPTDNTGTNADASFDLGNSGVRFKDGHFSGNINANTFTAIDGVYIGGTGFANKLDDYEEGTWTPTLIGTTSGSATVTVTTAKYTKVGNMVNVRGHISADLSSHNIVGVVEIGGIPFISASQAGGGSVGYNALVAGAVHLRPISSTLRLGKGDSNNWLHTELLTSSGALIFFEATYETAS